MSEGVRQRSAQSANSDKDGSTKSKDEEVVVKASGGWIRAILIFFVLTLTLPVVILILLPCPIDPVPLKLQEPPELVGVLEPNNLLQQAELLFQGQVSGPESIEVVGDHIYTGVADGWVIDIHEGKIKKLVQFGAPPCGGFENENTCGRPLGMRMGKDGFLYVVDAYLGLFKVNVATGDYTTLFSSKTPVNGHLAKTINDLDIADDGKIYFTHSSTKWHRNNAVNIVFEGLATGRLMVYDPATGKVKLLKDGIQFPNGIQLTKDQKSLLVADTVEARIYRYNIKTGETTVLADNLPGMPDNIRYCKSSGTYWIGFSNSRQRGKLTSVETLGPYPYIRGLLTKVITTSNIQTIVELTGASGFGIAAEMTEDGKIIRTLHDPDGSVVPAASQVSCSGGFLYFGGFDSPNIARLDLKKIKV